MFKTTWLPSSLRTLTPSGREEGQLEKKNYLKTLGNRLFYQTCHLVPHWTLLSQRPRKGRACHWRRRELVLHPVRSAAWDWRAHFRGPAMVQLQLPPRAVTSPLRTPALPWGSEFCSIVLRVQPPGSRNTVLNHLILSFYLFGLYFPLFSEFVDQKQV